MSRASADIFVCLSVGFFAPVLLFILCFTSILPGYIVSWVFWPCTFLVEHVFGPRPNWGTPEHPSYEGSPIDLILVLIGLVAAWVFYYVLVSSVVYLILRSAHRHKVKGPSEWDIESG
jgi:hypothetical protein